MSSIIIPAADDIEGMNRRERRQFERDQKKKALEPYQQLRVKDLFEVLPHLVPPIVDPVLSAHFRQLRINHIATMTLREVLIAKGVITQEEYDDMLKETIQKVMGAAETPNSPALAESKEAAQGEVKRLDEVPPPLDEADESAPRRLVEG